MKSLVIKTCIIVCLNLKYAALQSSSPPVWVGNTINANGYQEASGTPNGTLLGTITARGRNGVDVIIEPYDAATEAVIIFKYNITGNEATGYIYLNGELDRERMSSMELFFAAFDSKIGKEQVPAYRVTISILDINDNAPMFEEPFYQKQIFENATISEKLVRVKASDPDNGAGGSFKFRLEPAGQSASLINGSFDIDENSGWVTLKKKLDFENTSFYQYTIHATDLGSSPHSSNVSLVIKVLDIQDSPPYFEGLPYRIDIDENVDLKTSLNLAIKAYDRDIGVPNNVEYAITDAGKCNGLFGIDKYNGIIFTNVTGDKFDRDSQPIADSDINGVCRIVVEAIETNSSGLPQTKSGIDRTNTTVSITINDLNDNVPTFNRNHSSATVLEDTSNVPLNLREDIIVEDKDQDKKNNEYVLSLHYTDGSEVNKDHVYPQPQKANGKSQVVLRLGKSFSYDYETNRTVQYVLVARDSSYPNETVSCIITVYINNTNEHTPQFTYNEYSADAKEHNPSPGANNTDESILNITATDADSGLFGVVEYNLVSRDSNFMINKTTGELRTVVDPNKLLDRENRDNYILIVEAVDGGKLRNTTTIYINITDINDNRPQFITRYTRFTVNENERIFDPEDTVINATDRDQGGTNNSAVLYYYSIEPDYLKSSFGINNNTGNISLVYGIDYENLTKEKGWLTLTVHAYDLGEPRLTSTKNITIHVQDINDNAPTFNQTSYTFEVKEGAEHKTSIGFVYATDADGTEANRKISYYIETGGMDNFRMNGDTGEITVDLNPRIDRETVPSYNLTVLAIDRGTPPMNGTASVVINVNDKNDENPKFHESPFTASVNETASNINFTTCAAYDDDLNSNLSYSINITEIKYSIWANKNELATGIHIYNDGVVYLESALDREIFSELTLKLEVKDLNSETGDQTGTATLHLSIDDVNDNAPFFNSSTNISLIEGALSGTVATLTAVDRDSKTDFNFSLQKNPLDAFKLVASKSHIGSVQLARLDKPIDRETNETLEMILCVGDGSHTNCTLFNISVDDFNDNPPKFNQASIHVNLTETSGNATYKDFSLLNMSATDADIGPNADLSYKLESVKPDKYREIVNLKDGCNIYISGSIDRETVTVLNLLIEATDNPKDSTLQRTGSTTVVIDVVDLNDNAPEFKGRLNASVIENAEVGYTVLQLTALDTDGDDYNKHFFNFTNEEILFTLEPKGKILVKSDLRGHYGTHVLPVEVIDQENTILRNLANISIFVADTNDNKPIFYVPDTKFKVYECARIKTHITKLFANDSDAPGPNSRLNFSFIETTSDDIKAIFFVNASGDIYTKTKLNAANNSEYQFTVLATDNGSPQLTSDPLPINIFVVDVNDNPPKFVNDKIYASVPENVTNELVVTVHAEDDDLISDIRYSIGKVDREDLREYFRINKTTGAIWIVKELDRENGNQTGVTLTVLATDITASNITEDCEGFNKTVVNMTTSANVIVVVLDVNDNPPTFTRKQFSKGIRRNSKLETLIEDLKNCTTDLDIGENKIHSFSIYDKITYSSVDLKMKIQSTSSGNILICPKDQRNLPVCLTPNGTLLTNMLFEENMKGYISIPVMAADIAGNSTAVLKMYIISDDQTAAMLIYDGKAYVKQHQGHILGNFSKLLGKEFVPNGIESYVQDGMTDNLRTYLYFHVVDNGKVLQAVEAKKLIDDNAQHLSALASKYKISVVKEYKDTLPHDEDEGIKTLYIMVGIIVILGITVFTVGFCYCHSITRYQRKLKAATTKTIVDVDLKESHPGTNLYAKSTNPLLDKEAEFNTVDYKRYEDNTSVASYDSMQFEKKAPIGGDEEKVAVMDMFDETGAIQGEADALAMVLEQHKRERGESNMMHTPPAGDDDELLNTDFKHAFDNETFELSLETTEV